MKDKHFRVFFFVLLSLSLLFGRNITLAKQNDKVTICHATSSETNPYTQIVVSSNAIGGHFENPGTPKAGHEDDLLLEGEVECPAPTYCGDGTINQTSEQCDDGNTADGDGCS